MFTSLHGFCDASAIAYGAAVYLRIVTADGSVHTTLVSAKARVLPLRHITIPRAELLGAHLLAKLLTHVSSLLVIKDECLYAWTDSAIVLHWLAKDSSQLKDRFVANRVQACHDLLPRTKWKHVSTDNNPADLASRGVSASDLVHSQLWWSGPQWLSQAPDYWPNSLLAKPPEAIQVLKISQPIAMDSTQISFLNRLWSRFSSFHLLVRVVAWIFRFYDRLKKKSSKPTSHLVTSDFSLAKTRIIHLSHLQDFPDVFAAVKDDRTLPKSHPLHAMLPTLKDNNLLLQSRVRSITSSHSPRLPIPLHAKSPLTLLLLRTLHLDHSHAGVSALHSIVAASYYIKGLRNSLKAISRACAPCQRAYARPLSHQLGLLPSVRTTPALPFEKTGIDFAGPFLIRRGYTRRPHIDKTYAAIFVCMATKAVHFDLCASLSTVDFRATLSRFVARRGCPSDIFSDNGSHFLGAREEIRELEALYGSCEGKTMTAQFAQTHGIKWHNIPPRAPHFGGLREAAVRSMKILLKKNLQPHKLRFDELYTLLTEAESILNSRPLTATAQDAIQSGDYITAGHLLIGRPLRTPPTKEAPRRKIDHLTRWRLISRLKEEIWRQWLQQYLHTLQERTKWIRPHPPLKKDDLVYLKDETLRVRAWPIGRVTDTFPGDDGQVRAAKVLCRGKEYIRTTQLLIPLLNQE